MRHESNTRDILPSGGAGCMIGGSVLKRALRACGMPMVMAVALAQGGLSAQEKPASSGPALGGVPLQLPKDGPNPVPLADPGSALPQSPANRPAKAPPSLGGIPLELPKEGQGSKGAPSLGGIPLQVPRDTTGAGQTSSPQTAQRPMGRRMVPARMEPPDAGLSRTYTPSSEELGIIDRPVTYQFANQEYQPRGIGQWVDGVRFAYLDVSGHVQRLEDYGRAGVGTTLGGVHLDGTLTLGNDLHLPWFGVEGGGYRGYSEGLAFMVGPLLVDEFILGAGALYSDLNGNPPDVRGEDGWGSIAWLSARFTLSITESFQITIRPWVYWLPDEGEVGYGIPPFYLGFPFLEPASYVSATYYKEMGNWQMYANEYFGAYFRNLGLLDNNAPHLWLATDLTPVDYVGRYSLGGSGQSMDFGSDDDLSWNDDPFDEDRLYWVNRALLRFVGQHGGGVSSLTYFDRRDRWDHDLSNRKAWMHTGVWLIQQRDFISPYTGYNIYTKDDFDSTRQTAIAGFKWQMPPRLSGFLQGGYLFDDHDDDHNTWLAEGGVYALAGPYTRVGVQGGRRVSDYLYRDSFLENYVEGRIIQDLGPHTSLLLFVGNADRESLDDNANADESVLLGAANLVHMFPTRTSIGLLAGVEDIAYDNQSRDFTRWTYRFNVIQEVGESVQLNAFYQYQDSAGEGEIDDYTEHLLFFGVTKRL